MVRGYWVVFCPLSDTSQTFDGPVASVFIWDGRGAIGSCSLNDAAPFDYSSWLTASSSECPAVSVPRQLPAGRHQPAH